MALNLRKPGKKAEEEGKKESQETKGKKRQILLNFPSLKTVGEKLNKMEKGEEYLKVRFFFLLLPCSRKKDREKKKPTHCLKKFHFSDELKKKKDKVSSRHAKHKKKRKLQICAWSPQT
jgi:hypothetical protein